MANKIITSTIREPVLQDIDAIHIARDPDNPASLIMVTQYTLHTTTGDAYVTKTCQLPFTPAEKTTLVNYVTGTVLPKITEIEGPFV